MPMQKINIRKAIYHVRHRYLTFNNLVILTAFLIAAGWVWGSLQAMQRNYSLQKEVDLKQRELQLSQLQMESLQLQQRYYQTDEYKELAARDALGLVMPGEKILILPPNSEEAKKADSAQLLELQKAACKGVWSEETGCAEPKTVFTEPAGGVNYLKGLAAPLPAIRFCPTGGIGPKNAASYLALPNVVCVGGSWVAPAEALAAGDWAKVTALSREATGLGKG